MASTLAHELNQPLSAIANYVQGCRRMLSEKTDAASLTLREALEETGKQSLRAGQIIKHLREFVTGGDAERAPHPVRKLIEEAGVLALLGSREAGSSPWSRSQRHDTSIAGRWPTRRTVKVRSPTS